MLALVVEKSGRLASRNKLVGLGGSPIIGRTWPFARCEGGSLLDMNYKVTTDIVGVLGTFVSICLSFQAVCTSRNYKVCGAVCSSH